MASASSKSKAGVHRMVLGAKTFAAITAVEGLSLTTAGKKRLAALQAGNLTPDEKRAEVIRAYAGSKRRG